ncbi:SixA phosphatase family protein [Luteolibacter sp. AS25]|uniref:SixA phosphatase family protein n=1 Tax=Luteolibacter sp. AS25 TaxID=3135776 RepID=UPI00398B3B6F
MELLLLRHGKAEDHGLVGRSDFSRTLLEKGLFQAQHVARMLVASEFLPDIVLTSPVVRAKQTAEAFTSFSHLPGPVSQDWLSCGMSPETALKELSAFSDFKRVMIVGHEPDFSQLIQYTLGASNGYVEVKKGSLACIEINPPSPRANLRFLLPHKLAKHID